MPSHRTTQYAITLVLVSAVAAHALVQDADAELQRVRVHVHARAIVESRPAGEMAALVMRGCSRVVTLSGDCFNASNPYTETAFACVGSTVTPGSDPAIPRSCPDHPIKVPVVNKRSFTSTLDASGLNIERVASMDDERDFANYVYLQDNRLSNLTYSPTSSIQLLQLANNRFKSLDALVPPSAMVELNISSNPLERIQLSSSAYQNLEILDVSNALLHQLDTVSAGNLLTLLASHNKLSSFSEVKLPFKLRKLDLSHNQLLDWSSFELPRSLRELNASSNGATGFLPSDLASINKLRAIDFSYNAIQNVSRVLWPRHLERLDLRGNPLQLIEIRYSDLPMFKNLKQFLVTASLKEQVCTAQHATIVTVAGNVPVCVVSDRFVGRDPVDASDAPSPQESTQEPSPSPVPSLSIAQQHEQQQEESNALWIRSVVICIACALVVLFLVVVRHLRRRRMARGKTGRKSKRTAGAMTDHSLRIIHTAVATAALNELRADASLAPLRIDTNDVTRLRLIDEGAFATVALVRVGDRVLVRKQIREEVAVKNARAVAEYVEEIQLCATLEHPKIVQFHGFTWTSPFDLAVFSEFMENGNLAALLKLRGARADNRDSFTWFTSDGALPTKLDLAIDVAQAMVYLHSYEPPVLLRELRARLVLLSETWTAKLSVVGTHRELNEYIAGELGSVAWLAPEVLERGGAACSVASDVYAFGVLLSELDTCGAQPFADLLRGRTNVQLAQDILAQELKPLLHPDCPREIAAIVKACLRRDVAQRPSTLQVAYELSQLRRATTRIQTSEGIRHATDSEIRAGAREGHSSTSAEHNVASDCVVRSPR